MGITRSSFYNALGSQDALFKEALALYFEQSPDIAFAKAKPGVSIKALLTKTFKAACKARAMDEQGRGCMVVNGVAELCNVNDQLGGLLEETVLGSLARIQQLLECYVQSGARRRRLMGDRRADTQRTGRVGAGLKFNIKR